MRSLHNSSSQSKSLDENAPSQPRWSIVQGDHPTQSVGEQMGGVIGLQVADEIAVEEGKGRSLECSNYWYS